MHPWLLKVWGVPTYGVCLVIGIMLGWWWMRLRGKRVGLDAGRLDLMVPWVVGAGIAGAWIFGRWTDWVAWLPWGTTGYVVAGGMIGGTLAGIGYAWRCKIRLGVLGDVVAAPIALVIACGRLGCLTAGCCYGKTCEDSTLGHIIGLRFGPESVAYAEASLHGHSPTDLLWPTQIMEMLGRLLLAALLGQLSSRINRGKGVSGESFLALGLGYGTLRFGIEFLRADNPSVLGGLTFSQIVCVVLMLAAASTWWWRRQYLSGKAAA